MHGLFARLAFRAAIRRRGAERHTGCGVGEAKTSRQGKHGHRQGDKRDENRAKNAHGFDARSTPKGLQRSSNSIVKSDRPVNALQRGQTYRAQILAKIRRLACDCGPQIGGLTSRAGHSPCFFLDRERGWP